MKAPKERTARYFKRRRKGTAPRLRLHSLAEALTQKHCVPSPCDVGRHRGVRAHRRARWRGCPKERVPGMPQGAGTACFCPGSTALPGGRPKSAPASLTNSRFLSSPRRLGCEAPCAFEAPVATVMLRGCPSAGSSTENDGPPNLRPIWAITCWGQSAGLVL